MVRKLYALVGGECAPDNPDSPQHQEILLPGFLYGILLKEKLDDVLIGIRAAFLLEMRRSDKLDFTSQRDILRVLKRVPWDVGGKMSTFIATGNNNSRSGLDLQQTAGFTVVAEKLNYYRFLAHFRSVHRGAFFAELPTTSVRKLLPEAWGFLCPVHTPDGSPCGLLNHFAHLCQITTAHLSTAKLPALLISLGMIAPSDPGVDAREHVAVQLDGRIIGYATPTLAARMATALRLWKTERRNGVPLDLEIGLVPGSRGGQFPGLFLFASRARMMRPVTLVANGREDHVGPFEQVYLEVACSRDEIEPGVSTHVETAPTAMLSVLANLTPFSDFNQSPRNMYQVRGHGREDRADDDSARWASRRWARRRRLCRGGRTTSSTASRRRRRPSSGRPITTRTGLRASPTGPTPSWPSSRTRATTWRTR